MAFLTLYNPPCVSMSTKKNLFRYVRTLSHSSASPKTKFPPVLLPQNDNKKETRRQGLQNAKATYQLQQKKFKLDEQQRKFVNIVNVPPMLKKVPFEEKRSFVDSATFALTFVRYQTLGSISEKICGRLCGHGRWTIDDMVNQFSFPSFLTEPKGCEVWRTEAVDKEGQNPLQRAQADYWFAWERMNGVTRNLIKQVETIPVGFLVYANNIEQDHPYLGNISLEKHAEEGRVYVVDLSDVDVHDKKPAVVAPMALFVIWNKKLMPVAISLNKHIATSQVYKPALGGSAKELRPWVNAKIWFGMADSSYHESITHLGFTHMLMDGVGVCMHRNLSDRHPIFKLLHPHFRYMHTINSDAVTKLLGPGKYVDEDMYFSRVHMLKLIATHNENWTYHVDACIQTNLEKRRVKDLPGYFFRDDTLLIHSAIRKFVDEYASHYYRDDHEVQLDGEIQAFREELTRKRTMSSGGGCGMNGIPELTNIQNLVDVLTNFIYICSVEHSATNFPQYEQYGFPPNFPAMLHGLPEKGMADLNINMPTKKEMLSTIKVMKVLILTLTNSLGNYEEVYLNKMDNDGKTFVQNFQKDLLRIENHITQRNIDLLAQNSPDQVQEYPYEWLLPKHVLNSISN